VKLDLRIHRNRPLAQTRRRSSGFVLRSNKPALTRPSQDTFGDQEAEGLFARRSINSPQSLRLWQSDAEAGHLRVFRSYLFHERADRLT
jgi:hypothetical protein